MGSNGGQLAAIAESLSERIRRLPLPPGRLSPGAEREGRADVTCSSEATTSDLTASRDVTASIDGDKPGGTADEECACAFEFDDGTETLGVDASGCPHDGDLVSAPCCRAAAVDALTRREAGSIVVRSRALEHHYPPAAVSLFTAAGRFRDLIGGRDDRLAATVRTDPLAVADELADRVDPVADAAHSSGLVDARLDCSTEAALEPSVGLPIAHYTVDPSLDDRARLQDVTHLETGSVARIYRRPDGIPHYALEVVDTTLSPAQRRVVLEGYEAIAEGVVDGDRAASRAIEHVTGSAPDPALVDVLTKHTAGYGILEDLFADPRITDVYVTAPVESNPIRVVCDGASMTTSVSLTAAGGQALASRVRRTSGRAFSRASPTVDATARLENGTGVRVAGVADPVTEGVAFAFRERADDQFTLPGLVANETMTAEVAAFLSVAVERNAAALVAGTRGAGKTTLLGTLLYELPPPTRTVVIEDTPELPVTPLQGVDRDVQALRTGTADGPEITPADALQTALRLGDGALVVGEIRGEEARVLYEAMRVGANANAVLGTIHGDGAEDVYERVVSDLGVEPSSFGATDLVVTVQAYHTETGKKRRLARIEEVCGTGEETWFEPLYVLESDGERAKSTGRIARGESRLVHRLTAPGERYADVRASLADRATLIRGLAVDGRTEPAEVATAYAEYRNGEPTDAPSVPGTAADPRRPTAPGSR